MSPLKEFSAKATRIPTASAVGYDVSSLRDSWQRGNNPLPKKPCVRGTLGCFRIVANRRANRFAGAILGEG